MPVIQITHDGSPTLMHSELAVTYHSLFGAKSESEYVFIQQSELENKLNTQSSVHIVEIGLGTGLNAWLTYTLAKKYPQTKVTYTAFEIFPVSKEVLIPYYQALEDVSFASVIANFPENIILDNFQTDFKYQSWLEAYLPDGSADIIFYDAFAPKTCPELWTGEAIQKAIQMLKPDGIMTTFSVTGEIKRILKKLPVQVFTPKGFGKKREMLKVVKTIAMI
jgi:tRNA U34 5-methylaminomethyl-2-thiouridine-forming methyltransferase MnmC